MVKTLVKIAIVGPELSKWPKDKIEKVKQKIHGLLVYTIIDDGQYDSKGNYMGPPILVSGHCPKGGVDIWAENIADELVIEKQIFKPEVNQWNDKALDDLHGGKFVAYGYKTRNIKIAEACDVLYCIVPRICDAEPYKDSMMSYCVHCKTCGHPTNGGCYTAKIAKKLGKEVHIIVIE